MSLTVSVELHPLLVVSDQTVDFVVHAGRTSRLSLTVQGVPTFCPHFKKFEVIVGVPW